MMGFPEIVLRVLGGLVLLVLSPIIFIVLTGSLCELARFLDYVLDYFKKKD
jgi:hypothetical protein